MPACRAGIVYSNAQCHEYFELWTFPLLPFRYLLHGGIVNLGSSGGRRQP